jgi:hypothetical protein
MDKVILIRVSIEELINRLKVDSKLKCYVQNADDDFCVIISLDIIKRMVQTSDECCCFDEYTSLWILENSKDYEIEYQTN